MYSEEQRWCNWGRTALRAQLYADCSEHPCAVAQLIHCLKSHLGITKTCLEVPGISHLDSCPKTHAFLKKESRKTSSHGADRLAAGKQCWSEQLNGFVQGGESEIVTALRKAKALDDLEIISKCSTPVTPGHGSFQSEKKLKSKLHKLLPMDFIIPHNTALHNGTWGCLSQMQGLHPQSNCRTAAGTRITEQVTTPKSSHTCPTEHSHQHTDTYTMSTKCSHFTYLESNIHGRMKWQDQNWWKHK